MVGREGGILPLQVGLAQEWHEAAAFESGRRVEAGRAERASGTYPGVRRGRCLLACVLLARDADDERHSGRNLPIGALVPRAVLAQLIAVVAPKDDDGVLAEAEAIELGEDAPIWASV